MANVPFFAMMKLVEVDVDQKSEHQPLAAYLCMNEK